MNNNDRNERQSEIKIKEILNLKDDGVFRVLDRTEVEIIKVEKAGYKAEDRSMFLSKTM